MAYCAADPARITGFREIFEYIVSIYLGLGWYLKNRNSERAKSITNFNISKASKDSKKW